MTKRKRDAHADEDEIQQYTNRETRDIPATAPWRDCMICAETCYASNFPIMPHLCTSVICRTCWKKYLATELEQKLANRIKCPNCDGFLTEADFKKLATKETYDRFLAKSTKELLSQNPNFRECPSSNCSYGYIMTQDDLQSDAIFNCHVCHAKYCTRCEVPMHLGETCKDYNIRIAREGRSNAANETATMNFLRTFAKPCPECSVMIRKGGGCDHMTCDQCKHEFCWICLAPYRYIQGAIFRIDNVEHEQTCSHHETQDQNAIRDDVELSEESEEEIDYGLPVPNRFLGVIDHESLMTDDEDDSDDMAGLEGEYESDEDSLFVGSGRNMAR